MKNKLPFADPILEVAQLCRVMKAFAAVAVATHLLSCESVPADPYADTAFNRAEYSKAYQSAVEDRGFQQDPFGWGAGRQASQADMLFRGYVPTEPND